MNMSEVVEQIETVDVDSAICAKKPWNQDSECVVVELDDTLAVPADVEAAGFAYFLEVHVAREVLQVFGDRRPSMVEKVRLLVHYADNDAYPDWVYS
jgi:hypothetical protein